MVAVVAQNPACARKCHEWFVSVELDIYVKRMTGCWHYFNSWYFGLRAMLRRIGNFRRDILRITVLDLRR
jgi:hypothetical protein